MILNKLQSFYPKDRTNRILMTFVLMNAFGFVALSGARGFLVAFLEYIGYSAGMIGAIVSLTAAFGIAGQFLFGFLCDKFGRIKPFYFVLMIAMLVSVFLIYAVRPPIEMMFVAFAIMGLSIPTCIQLVDSWILESGEAIKQRYGVARSASSFGWATGLLVLGSLVVAFGYEVLPLVSLIFVSIAFMLAYRQPDAAKAKHEKKISLASIKELFKNYRYIHLLVTTFMIYGVISAEWILNGVKAAQLATPVLFGFFFGILAMAEVPFFAVFQRIQARFKLEHIFIFGMSMYVVRITLMGLAPNIWVMMLIAFTNAFAYAPCYICTKLLIDAEIPPHLKTTGQLIAAAVFTGLSGIIFPVAIGLIVDAFGLNIAFFALAAFVTLPLTSAVIYSKLPKQSVA